MSFRGFFFIDDSIISRKQLFMSLFLHKRKEMHHSFCLMHLF
ncbi:hypothetical protein HMPREF9420_0692 [Segatella salivae DSM 15606]|uniref:Uncharacterized protein n=1 Tax=Segatella salivae DSM 15606 TaxID=888832 RepID=E6MMH4_9BACT|nr:hypothetical protein HMPREF9420_0692 [Segatella salivae DSM 15606]